METLSYAFHAIMPILLMIALGYLLRTLHFLGDSFYKQLNSFCYKVLLPVQLFYNVYQVDALQEVNWRVLGYTVVWIPIGVFVGMFAAKILIKERSQQGAFVQATFRSNQAILGLPLASALGGNDAVIMASLATSIGIPLFNISAVIVLKYYSIEEGKKNTVKDILKAVITNPLILGVFCGIVCVAIRSFIPVRNDILIFSLSNNMPSVMKAVSNISPLASPIMLICLGARLDLKLTGKLLPQIVKGVSMRLIVIPVTAIGIALILKAPLNLTQIEIPMMLSFFASPVAVSSSILVHEIGGDDQYASQLIVWSSVFSMLTLFLLVAGLRGIGML